MILQWYIRSQYKVPYFQRLVSAATLYIIEVVRGDETAYCSPGALQLGERCGRMCIYVLCECVYVCFGVNVHAVGEA